MKKLTMAGVISAIALTTACSNSGSDDSTDSTDSGSGSGGSGSVSGTISLTGAVALPEQMSLVTAQDSNETGTTNSLRSSRAIHDTSAYASDSDYVTSRQNTYVYLDAMEPISFIDSLLCFVNQSRPLLMKDEGNYISWNDAGRCFEENGSQGETQSQGGDTNQAPSYITIVADSAQASATDPLIFRGWVADYAGQSGDGNGPDAIRMLGEVRKTPTDDNPFGEFTLSYGLLPTINATSADSTGSGEVISSETTDGGASFTLYQEDIITENFGQGEMTVNCTTQASVDYNEATETGLARTGKECSVSTGGELPFNDTRTYALSVNPDYVHMASATDFDNLAAGTYENDVCLARDDFNEVAWGYNLFNKADGSAVAINSGLQLKVDSNGDGSGSDADGFESWGHIGYWGSWREDGQQFSNGESVQKATYDGSTGDSYTVKVAPGRLIKNTVESLNLADLDGVTFSTFLFEGDTYLLSGSGVDLNNDGQYNNGFEVLLEANTAGNGFEIVGTREWTENGPSVNDINPAVAVPLNTNAVLHMWSNQLGGDIRYLAGASKIRFFSRSFVDGGETGTGELFDSVTSVTLKCFERCLDVNVTAAEATGNQEDVFVNGNFGDTQDYSFAQSDLTLKVGADSVTFANGVTSDNLQSSQNWQWGLHSGAMITSTVATANSITNVGQMFQAIESGTITEFYVWETGLEPWQQQTILVNGSSEVVSFDRPITIKYTHETANDRNGGSSQNGQVYLLEYGGPGQLWGFPWSQDGENWVPQITLKDGVILGSSDQYVIKATDVEQKMAVVADSNCTDLPLTAPSQAVPTSVTGEVFDIGDMPTLTDETPSVIDGEPVE